MAFPWCEFFPLLFNSNRQKFLSFKRKRYCQACLCLPSPPPGMKLYHLSPEVFVVQTNQVQMVFATSDIVGRKAFVVIYWNAFCTKSQTPAPQRTARTLFSLVCAMAFLCWWTCKCGLITVYRKIAAHRSVSVGDVAQMLRPFVSGAKHLINEKSFF